MSGHRALEDRIRARVRDVPDFPRPGILFKDLAPAFGDGPLQAQIVAAFAERYRDQNIDAIAAVESRGFILGAPIAVALECALVPVRKHGKLPGDTISESYALEYGTDTLEVQADAVPPGARVVVIDDLLATGGTMAASIALLRGVGAHIVEVGFLIELAFLEGRSRLNPHDCFSLVTYRA